MSNAREVVPIRWVGDVATGYVEMIDQKLLPRQEVWHRYGSYEGVASAIRDMVIRGAPAIGIAAAFGVVLAVRAKADLALAYSTLANTRPTAVNLFWALERMQAIEVLGVEAAFAEAAAILEEDRANNLRMGKLGSTLLPNDARILTHCNTGALATGGYGTALGIIRAHHKAGRLDKVWVGETRPYLQGARLTAWECRVENIPATLITDGMAGHFMKLGQVDAVIVGTDRVAANGDVANKIGTYSLAVLCKHHGIPFYVGAPISTVDLATPNGEGIAIEERNAREVTHVRSVAIAPEGIDVAHPAFDVTPAELVTAIVTEEGVATAPYDASLGALVAGEPTG